MRQLVNQTGSGSGREYDFEQLGGKGGSLGGITKS
jgi:hypothetical protein